MARWIDAAFGVFDAAFLAASRGLVKTWAAWAAAQIPSLVAFSTANRASSPIKSGPGFRLKCS